MRSKKRVNKYPYILLGFIHVAMLAYTFYKSENRKRTFVVLMNFAGFAYLFEYIAVSLFDVYAYKPKIFKQRNVDNIFGAILSQFFYVPVTATFITTLKLGWKMKLFFSILYSVIEKIFLYLGIFKNKWWRTRYTFSLILLAFFVNDAWGKQLDKKQPFFMYFSLFNLIQVSWMNTVFILSVFKKIRYGMPPFLTWKENFTVSPMVGIFISLLSAWWLKKGNFVASLKMLALMIITDFTLIKNNYLKWRMKFILPMIYAFTIAAANYYRYLVYGEFTNKKYKLL